MVTPTGAAIVTALASFEQPPMRVERVGYGLGTRNPERYPNAAALWVGEAMGEAPAAGLRLLETNVDDMSAEMLAYAQERLFDLGARDVWFTPVQMKKGRPATMLSALVDDDLEAAAVDVIMRETSTLGVRVRPVSRYEAEREVVELQSSLGAVSVKVKSLGRQGRRRPSRVRVLPPHRARERPAAAGRLPHRPVRGRHQAALASTTPGDAGQHPVIPAHAGIQRDGFPGTQGPLPHDPFAPSAPTLRRGVSRGPRSSVFGWGRRQVRRPSCARPRV